MPFKLSDVSDPILLLDLEKAHQNISRMFAKAKSCNITFRPHFKTHQCAAVGEIFSGMGIDKITVSSLAMAEFFAASGWQDITVAFPVNIREIQRINSLAASVQLNLLFENPQAVSFLSENLKSEISAWIKIDTGYHRTGCDWQDEKQILKLIALIEESEKLQFAGLLTHAGHTYAAQSTQQILEIYQDTVNKMQRLQQKIGGIINSACPISIGDTPGCSLAENFSGIDEIRPGNFVFFDAMQYQLGSCTAEDIAVVLAAPVVAKHPQRQQIVIHGGAVHLSKDRIPFKNGAPHYGLVVPLDESNGWGNIYADSYVCSLSQEHGIIQAEAALFDSIEIGDLVCIVPVHSCLTANLVKKYATNDGRVFNLPQF